MSGEFLNGESDSMTSKQPFTQMSEGPQFG